MDEPEIIAAPESLLDSPAQPAPEASPEFPPTNLSDRFHQGQDPVASIRHRQAEQEQALTALMRRDHEARDLYWRGQQVEMDRAAHASRMRTEDEHFRHLAELHPLQLTRAEAESATARAEAKSRESAEHLKAEVARRTIEDTSAFQQKMLGAIREGAVPRTEPFRNLLLTGRLEHPWMDTTHYGEFWKAHSGSPDDPEQAARDFQLAQQAQPLAATAVTSPSPAPVGAAPPTPAGSAPADTGKAPLDWSPDQLRRAQAEGRITREEARRIIVAQVDRAQQRADKRDNGVGAVQDFGARVLGANSEMINRSLEGIVRFAFSDPGRVISAISTMGASELAHRARGAEAEQAVINWFKANADYARDTRQGRTGLANPAMNDSIHAGVAEALGTITGSLPATTVAAVALPEAAGAAAVTLLARLGMVALENIPAALQFAASAAAEKFDECKENQQSDQVATRESLLAALHTLKALPLYVLVGKGATAAAAKIAQPLGRSAAHVILNGVGNMIASGTLRTMEGGPLRPDGHSLGQDWAFALTSLLPTARAIKEGTDPHAALYQRVANDPEATPQARAKAAAFVQRMQENADTVIKQAGGEPVKTAGGKSAPAEPPPLKPEQKAPGTSEAEPVPMPEPLPNSREKPTAGEMPTQREAGPEEQARQGSGDPPLSKPDHETESNAPRSGQELDVRRSADAASEQPPLTSGQRAPKRPLRELQTVLDELAEKHLLPKYRAVDPNLKAGYTGSFKTGKVGNRNKKATIGKSINLDDFDIDFWIESDKFHQKHADILQPDNKFRRILAKTPGFEGLRPNKKGFSILFKPSRKKNYERK